MSARDILLKLRAEIDAAIAEMDLATPSVVQRGNIMKVGAFAESRGYSARTVRDYCDLGMPHRGEGKSRRVLVAEADIWISLGGPRKARLAKKGKAA